eukprot:gnl/TRDRNA2_/TRDRNA2_216375_c0_seq1.p1 gnl/TRDRNA2_/TRDRNA2_216375_c0~~gnl/TRDRNA2_/TRDRNA2_216375_c0_seq1.p1  ORF type:complete len:113 (-),score=19.30 gnl/TRDRNA2_/TRDRNA2_216375_c0_seq1:36-374(-)
MSGKQIVSGIRPADANSAPGLSTRNFAAEAFDVEQPAVSKTIGTPKAEKNGHLRRSSEKKDDAQSVPPSSTSSKPGPVDIPVDLEVAGQAAAKVPAKPKLTAAKGKPRRQSV